MVDDYQQDLHHNSSSRQKHQIKALKFSWQIEDKQNDSLDGQKNYVDEDYKDEWTYKKVNIFELSAALLNRPLQIYISVKRVSDWALGQNKSHFSWKTS